MTPEQLIMFTKQIRMLHPGSDTQVEIPDKENPDSVLQAEGVIACFRDEMAERQMYNWLIYQGRHAMMGSEN